MAITHHWTPDHDLPQTMLTALGWSFTATSPAQIDPQNTDIVASPDGAGSRDRTHTRTLRMNNGFEATCPTIWSTGKTTGAIAFRFRHKAGETFNAARSLVTITDSGGSDLVEVQPRTTGATTTRLDLNFDGVTVPSAVSQTIVAGTWYWLTLRFDFTGSDSRIRLYIDGTLWATSTNVAAFTIGNFKFSNMGAGGDYTYIQDVIVFDSDTDDDALDDDLWVWPMPLDAISGDAEWSIFGGGSDKVTEISDGDSATGIEATLDPSDFDVTVQDRDTVLSGWAPEVKALGAFVIAAADVIQDTTLAIKDADGTAGTTNATISASLSSVYTHTVQDSSAAAVDGTRLDEMSLTLTAATP